MDSQKTNKIDFKDLVCFYEIAKNRTPATTSLIIAEIFGKQHKHVLRDIENLAKTGEFDESNFGPIFYKDSQNRDQKMFALDELFTGVLLMGFTGKKAIKWKVAYAKEFKRLRDLRESENKVIRKPFDDPAELNKSVNHVFQHVRSALGLETKNYHYINLAETINECTFGDKGRGKKLRQSMDLTTSQILNRNLSGTIKGILKGAVKTDALKEHLVSLDIKPIAIALKK
jgi:Rha family phage regulatory protein